MAEPDEGGRVATRAFAIAALALAGFLFSLTPIASSLDDSLLDLEWRLIRKFDPRPAPDDIIIVGIDPATVSSITEPPAFVARGDRARSRAHRGNQAARDRPRFFRAPGSFYDAIRAGLDRALFTGPRGRGAERGPSWPR